MFVEYDKRFIADGLKRLVMQGGPVGRERALEWVQRFEQVGWEPQALDEAVSAAAPGKFYLEDGKLEFENNGVNTRLAVMDVIDRYLEVKWPESETDLLTTKEAADYLRNKLGDDSISERTIKHAHHDLGDLKAIKKAKTLLFSKADLDEFATRRRKRGGQRKVQPVAE